MHTLELRKPSFTLPLVLCLGLLLTCSCSTGSKKRESSIDQMVSELTLRQKVGQLFVVRPEVLDSDYTLKGYNDNLSKGITSVTDNMTAVNEDYSVGGFILYSNNIQSPSQLTSFVTALKGMRGAPFIMVDEEGGSVARIAGNPSFAVASYESIEAVGNTGDHINALNCGSAIGKYLHKYGIDLDLAPVADLNSNPSNRVMGDRAFTGDPELGASMAIAFNQGLLQEGVYGCLKHFPGHGDTSGDSHLGYAETYKTWNELLECEVLPFQAGIMYGATFIMVGHISAPEVTGNGTPSSLSSTMITEKLRTELGFKGIVITDAMEMSAITERYTSGEAAIAAIKAGADLILSPENFTEAYDAVVAAVQNGDIPESRIDESVKRLLPIKLQVRGVSTSSSR